MNVALLLDEIFWNQDEHLVLVALKKSFKIARHTKVMYKDLFLSSGRKREFIFQTKVSLAHKYSLNIDFIPSSEPIAYPFFQTRNNFPTLEVCCGPHASSRPRRKAEQSPCCHWQEAAS